MKETTFISRMTLLHVLSWWFYSDANCSDCITSVIVTLTTLVLPATSLDFFSQIAQFCTLKNKSSDNPIKLST